MINFPDTFNVDSLHGTTILQCAESIMDNTTDVVVPQAALYRLTSVYSNAKSVESVRGTCSGGDITSPKHKLRGTESFKRKWVVCTKNNKIYFVERDSKELKFYDIVKPTYDTHNKNLARENSCFWALRQIETPSPKITTLGGPEAKCAAGFYLIKPNAKIINVDKNDAVLEASAKLGFPMENKKGDIGKILRRMIGKNTGVLVYATDDFQDLINYDSDGYFCETMSANLKAINDKILCEWLCLTIQAGTIRNHGDFAEAFRNDFGKDKNAIPKAIEIIMSNYELVRHLTYKRSKDSNCEMRTMVFKLK